MTKGLSAFVESGAPLKEEFKIESWAAMLPDRRTIEIKPSNQ